MLYIYYILGETSYILRRDTLCTSEIQADNCGETSDQVAEVLRRDEFLSVTYASNGSSPTGGRLVGMAVSSTTCKPNTPPIREPNFAGIVAPK